MLGVYLPFIYLPGVSLATSGINLCLHALLFI